MPGGWTGSSPSCASEVPHLKRLPSEYMRSNVWFTTQPVEEPEPREHLADAIEWMGWDRVLFATDYPHWDFDDPAHALPIRMTEAQRRGSSWRTPGRCTASPEHDSPCAPLPHGEVR